MTERLEPRSVARVAVALLLLVLIAWGWSYVPPNLHRESHDGRIYLVFSERRISEFDSSSPEFQGFDNMINRMRGEAPRNRRWHALGFAMYIGDYPKSAPDSGGGWIMLPYVAFIVPYWSLATVSGLVALATLWRVWRRKRAEFHGHCLSCGYDLRFSRDRCPECGSLIPEPATTHDAAA